jgi:methylenetetrahydrofolate reductase (NADPH)
MKIAEILKQRMSLSFDVFPPKEADGIPKLQKEVDILEKYHPDFISCTYGAGGTNVGKSQEVCKYVQKDKGITCMTHFTCIGTGKDRILKEINEYRAFGVENILALRGDFPVDPNTGDVMSKTGGAFNYASDLVAFIHQNFGDMCIACAGDPEVHPAARSVWSDVAFMRRKQDEGASFIMAQTCHDVEAFERWVERLRHCHVNLPIVLGVMPVQNCIVGKFGPNIQALTMNPNESAIPRSLAALIGKYTPPRGASEELTKKYHEDFKKAGMEWTVDQIHRLMCCDLQGIHLYTMNHADVAVQIVEWAGLRPSPDGANNVHNRPCMEMGRF